MTFIVDGTNGLTFNDSSTQNVTALNASNISAGTLGKARLPTGSVLQVVQSVKTDTFSNSTINSWVDITGLSVSITPTSSSSRVLVNWNICFGGPASYSPVGYYLRLVRNSTAIALGDSAGSRLQVTAGISPSYVGSYDGGSSAINFIDSPATTSATTYKVQLYQISGTQTFYVNRSSNDTNSSDLARWISTITVTEIAA